MKARGDTGQIKRAEQLLGEIQILKAQAKNTDAKLNAILKHLNIEAPPPTAPPPGPGESTLGGRLRSRVMDRVRCEPLTLAQQATMPH